MGKMDEQIIVVNRASLFGEGADDLTFQGTEQEKEHIVKLEKRIAEHYKVMRRGDAEENPLYKQPIPYAVLKKGNLYFTYRRLGGGGESRLYGKLSIGVGGHMNAVTNATNFKEVLQTNLNREINEELRIENAGDLDIQTIGLINDDDTEVGHVHIGVLIAIKLPDDAFVTVREEDKLEGSWRSLNELRTPDVYSRMESWSALAIDALNRDE
ncbi:hypothetical protein ACFP7A_03430 [Sporolactobacillus kofuensis]|uniref:Nudix hydrolase domain-containing protein n=1 Tax=Sporolactobacillus kofuensis TaxID=269672 RepID=A0ABW1WEW2_9BACL|nr:hypothetical protein [Sporolactobacillus kofuensis]MCO7174547.1 hypothetical protein [Sporolactobacillus kofuensis]